MSIDGIGLLVYAVMIRAFGKYNLSIKFSAITVGVAPFVINKIIAFIMLRIYNSPIEKLFVPADIVISLLQLIVAFIIFYMMQQRDDDLVSWFTVAIFGAGINYMLIPYVVPMFVSY